jgi:hypothetical protein
MDPLTPACASGNLRLVTELVAKWKIVRRACVCNAFVTAMRFGNIHILEFLHAQFKFDYLELNITAYQFCKDGCIGLITFIQDSFEVLHIPEIAMKALFVAAQGGWLDLIEYIHIKSRLTLDQVRTSRAFQEAVVCGHLVIVKYLHKTWNITLEDVRLNSYECLVKASENNDSDVVKYLLTQFPLKFLLSQEVSHLSPQLWSREIIILWETYIGSVPIKDSVFRIWADDLD